MSDTCPTIDQARVKQVQDAVKILYDNKGPEDETNSISNLLGCMSGELSHALSPLEDLDAADTSIPNNVDEETVATTQSIFSEMFRENIGNSENEKEFVSFAMKMVFAITNHLENSSSADNVDPRVEELVGGVSTRIRGESVVSTPVDGNNNHSISPLAKKAGILTTTVVKSTSDFVGAILTWSYGKGSDYVEHYTTKGRDYVADYTTSKVAQARDKVADVTRSGVETVVEYGVVRPIVRPVSDLTKKVSKKVSSNPYFSFAYYCVYFIFIIIFFINAYSEYVVGKKDTLAVMRDDLDIISSIYKDKQLSYIYKSLSIVWESLKMARHIRPALEDPNVQKICQLNFGSIHDSIITLSRNSPTYFIPASHCVFDLAISKPFWFTISDVVVGGYYLYKTPYVVQNLWRSSKKMYAELDQTAGEARSSKKSRRKRKAKKAKKKTRKNHKKNTRKNRKKSKRYTKKN